MTIWDQLRLWISPARSYDFPKLEFPWAWEPIGIHALCDFVRKEGPEVLFLQETRLQARVLDKLKLKLGFHNCQAVSIEGKSGGIASLWKKQFKVDIQSYSKFLIHAKVSVTDEDMEPWWLIGLYGQPDVSKRYESCSLLRSLKVPRDKGWLLIQDCNEILSNNEKKWGKAKI